MTQENKDLLLRDLCARLPYKTKIQLTEYSDLTGEKLPSKIKTLDYCTLGKAQAYCKGFRKDEIKPYLFPLSSMTEEQSMEFALLQVNTHKDGFLYVCDCANMMKWLLKNHFDIYGLIEKGLAIDGSGLNIY